jgi:hypothetical protein
MTPVYLILVDCSIDMTPVRNLRAGFESREKKKKRENYIGRSLIRTLIANSYQPREKSFAIIYLKNSRH